MLGDPAIQVHRLAFRERGVRLGAAEEHQRLDDPAELDGTPQRGREDPSILLARSLLPQRDLDLSDEDRQRSPQLMRGVAAEPPLPLIGDVQPGQEFVERTPQLVELVASPGLVQAPAGVAGVEAPRRRDHPRQRCERPPGEPPTEQGRNEPGPHAQGDEEPAQSGKRRLGRVQGGPCGQDQGGDGGLRRLERRASPCDRPRLESRMSWLPRAGCGTVPRARRVPDDRPAGPAAQQ